MRGGGGSCVCECVRACLSERENRGEKVRERVGKSRKLYDLIDSLSKLQKREKEKQL